MLRVETVVLLCSILILLFSAGLSLFTYFRTLRTVRRLDAMLEAAMKGSFSEQHFDESRVSAVETKMSQYLRASEHKEKEIADEHDRIKALIADISHQTKVSIANLLLYSELLHEELQDPESAHSAQMIHEQATKLQFLTDSLVKLSRLESGMITLHKRPSPIKPLFTLLCETYAPKARKKGIALTIGDTSLSAVFDPKWTAEALGNLVDNAVKYTKGSTEKAADREAENLQEGTKPQIRLQATAYEMLVRIDISDTGIGIPEEEIPRIFKRFYRSESAAEVEGVGIGLSLARRIITMQGGYIKVSSVLGKGSTFFVFLPKG